MALISYETEIERNGIEIRVEINSEGTSIAWVVKDTGRRHKEDAIKLTETEENDARERLFSMAISLAKRGIDFSVDDYMPTNREQDAAADRYFSNLFKP